MFLLKYMHHRIYRNYSTHIITQISPQFLWDMNIDFYDISMSLMLV